MPRRCQTLVVCTLVVFMSFDMAQACRCWRARYCCPAPCAVTCYTLPSCWYVSCLGSYRACCGGYGTWGGACDACGSGSAYYESVVTESASFTVSRH